MRVALVRTAAAFALPLVAALGAGIAAAQPARSAAPTPAPIRETYLADCAVCHGSDAGGTDRGPSLEGVGAASIDYMVSTGRMPLSQPTSKLERKPPKYSPAVVHALVAYTAGLAGGPPVPTLDLARGDVAAGGEVFRLDCAACHAWSGDGGALYARAAPPLGPATPTQIAEAIRTGPGSMPVFGTAAIDSEQLNDVVAYVRYLDHPRDRGGVPLWHVGPVAEGAVAIVLGLGASLLVIRGIGENV